MTDQATGAATDGRLILLDDRDNVFVLRARLAAGDVIAIAGVAVRIQRDLPIGHKIARRPIAAGEQILKYGAPIGRATVAIAAGSHVHVHNVVSDYTPTYHLDGIDVGRSKG